MIETIHTVLRLMEQGHIDRQTAQSLVRALRQPPADPGGPHEPDLIAVIGVAAELPGAASYEDFWRVLRDGEDRIAGLPAARRELCEPYLRGPYLHKLGAPDRAAEAPEYMDGAWLDGIDLFDADFFKVTPADARTMDPQQRRFLQVAYHCLEDAGWSGRIRGTSTGVYVAIAGNDYDDAIGELPPSAVPGQVTSFAASRLSFLYDLHGPAFVTSSTCSSSLVALHDAVLGLRAGDCDMAIVGGVNIFSFPVRSDGWLMDASGIMSGGARCRPFDEAADGIGRGEGCIAVLLKPLGRALADRDRIRAVIRGSAINNDGTSAALTAPNPRAHSALLEEAWRRSGISPATLSYIEAHGTGTSLGDPIEVRGISDAVRKHSPLRQFIALGSVKGNIGHLVDGAAGLSGLVKAMLVLEHGCVPPTVNFNEPSSHIDFLSSPVFIPSGMFDLRGGRQGTRPLRAGVSCFGFNGTNVHVVLEEAPARVAAADPGEGDLVFPLSARSKRALAGIIEAYGRGSGKYLALRAVDVAFTLSAGREHFCERVAIIARTTAEFAERCAVLAGTPADRWDRIGGVVTAGTPRRRVADAAGPSADAAGPAADALGLAELYASDGRPPLEQFGDTGPCVVGLPLYPFDELPYWLAVPVAPAPPAPAMARQVAGRLPQPDDGRPEPGNGRAPDVLRACIEAVATTLGYDDIEPEDSFIGRGGSSLAALAVQSTLLKEHGFEVGMEEILAADDLRALAALIDVAHTPRE
jgi:acyl transferase domain-containing protein